MAFAARIHHLDRLRETNERLLAVLDSLPR